MKDAIREQETLNTLRDLLSEGDLFVLCSPGGLVSYCSATLRDLIGEDLQGRSLHHFMSDEHAARTVASAQNGLEYELEAAVAGKHFRCRMRPNADKSFAIVFMPVAPGAVSFMQPSSALMMQREIRDSIQVILASLQQMTPAEKPADRLYRAMIRRQSLKLLRLGDNMTDLADFQNGTAEMHVEQLELCRLLAELGEQLNGLLSQGSCLHLTLPEEPCYIRGDRNKLLRIVLNLVCNSLQHAGLEEVQMYLRLQRQGDQIRLIYRDNGVGNEGLSQQIFDKNLTDEPLSGEALGGAGFGVSLIRAFAQLHGGGLVVTTAPEGGPAFVVCLRDGEDRPLDRLHGDRTAYQDGADLCRKELSPALAVEKYM